MSRLTVGLVGDGPAVAAARAAFDDVDATTRAVGTGDLDGVHVGVVVAPAGADAFDAADDHADRWIGVEVGGVGGHPLGDVDAAVGTFHAVRYGDLRSRVAANASLRDADAGSDGPHADRSAVRLAGAVAGRRAVATLAGADLDGTVVEVAGATVGPERRVLPVPDARPDRTLRREASKGDRPDAVSRAERAVDDRVGLVHEIGERESFPAPYYLSRTADTTAFSDARAAELAAGVAAEWEPALMKALGEALERYAAGAYRTAWLTTATERSLATPVSPARFPRPGDDRPPDPTEPVRWVEGEHLATGERVSLPAGRVYHPPPTERHGPAITTGLGLGSDGPDALLSGLYEVIERDATMVAWYSTFEPLGLTVDREGYATLARRARGEGLAVTPLLVTTDVDVPVVAVAVHREDGWPRFAVGSDADLDAGAAATGALAEALQNWMELRSMGPDAADEESAAIGEYADFPDPARAFVATDRTVPAASVGPDDPPTGAAELTALVERVVEADLDPYAARITPDDVELLGFEAVRVLVPEAQPLFTGDPFFAARAETVPRTLGYEPRLDRPYHPYP
jgi:ribosomal protein S12 methylthiotransferase accessory factor